MATPQPRFPAILRRLTALGVIAAALCASAQVPDTLKHTILPPPVGTQSGAGLGSSVAVDGGFVVCGAPLDDTGATDAGVVKVFDSTTGVLRFVLPNPSPTDNDQFGLSVAISGTRVVVGAPLDDSGAVDAGCAYVYELSSGTPTVPVFTLNKPSPVADDEFGYSVAISGTRVVVGAPWNDSGATDAGGAYVYDLSSGTPTVPVATLTNPAPGPGDWFGWSVGISGTRVVVAARLDDTGAIDAGSAYVFDINSGTPNVPVATLNNPTPAMSDYFAVSVAISGTRVIVGANNDDTGANNAGSAYIYEMAGASPSVPVVTLNNPSPSAGDGFGNSVAISGTRVVVGAINDDTGATDAGSTYVYDVSSGTPTVPVATLNNPSPAAGDSFGLAVAISDMQVVVGANLDDAGATDAGSAYVYNFSSGTPTVPVATLNNSGPVAGDNFGNSVAVSGRWMVVGAYRDDTGGTDSGSAYVYDLSSTTPTVPVLTLPNPAHAPGDQFGYSVAISGTRVVVGAWLDDTVANDAGSAYVYDLASGTPTVPVATLNKPGPAAGDYFGYSVAISGTKVVVAAVWDDTGATNTGSAYIYDLESVTPTIPVVTLHNPHPGPTEDFGTSVAISGTRVVVSARLDDTGAADAGSVYVYDLGSGTPTVPIATLNNPRAAMSDYFGVSVAIFGTRVVVGANGDDTGASNAGSAYVYDMTGSTPTVPVVTLNNPSPSDGDGFGHSVAISGTRVVVGAPWDDTGASDSGCAYVYDLSSGTPTVPIASLNNPSPAGGDCFGYSVAIDEFTVAIGTPYDDTVMTDKGAVYVYGPSQWDVDAGFTPLADSDVSAAAMQADGKLLIGGGFSDIDGVARNYVARLNGDGTLDADFNPDADFMVSSIAVQNDGKVLIGGAFNNVGGVMRNYLARLDSSGSVDGGFNPDLDYVVSSMLIQADGKIVIGGSFTAVGGVTRNRVARLLTDGTLDSGFNPEVDGDVLSLALQGDGKILVGGNFTAVGGVARNGIARLNANGSVDTGFNPNANLDVMSMAVQVDGKLVIGGAFTTVGGVARNHCARLNGDGSLDLTFNPNVDDNVVSTAIRVDGSIVIGGSFNSVGGTTRHGVARLSASGSLDSGFAPSADDAVTSVMIDGDGRIVLGGYFTMIDGIPRSHFARLTTDASTQSLTVPDLSQVRWLRGGSAPEAGYVSFDLSTNGGATWSLLGAGTRTVGGWELTGLSLPVSGQVRARARTAGGQGNGSSGLLESVTSFSYLNVNAEAVSVALQADGKTVVGGRFTNVGTTARNRIARFNSNGTLDAGFNPDANNAVLGTAVQPDGKIVIGGSFTTVGGVPRNSIARLNADGTVETAFNPGANAAVNSIGLQTDGKIVLGGSFINAGGSTRNRCARLNATGTLDTGFNPNVNGAVNSVAIQPDGKILLGGAFTSVGSTRNGIARLNANGSLEAFNPNVTGGSVSCLALQADGRILLGGSFTTVGGTARNRLARVNADGSLDATFNPNADGTVTSMVVQTDGKILIGGSFTTLGATPRGRLARLLADGTVDTTFAADADNSISCLALKADGKLLVGGTFTAIAGSSISYLALLSNDPATTVLTVPDYTRVQWLRGGTSPETQQVTFELSTDGGTVWSSLGVNTRIAGGWEKTGLDLSGSGLVRARARTRGGQFGGSSGLVETVTSYTGFVPEIAVEQPSGTNIADGGSKNFGNVVIGSNASLTFTILNSGLYPLTGLGITIDGTNSSDFTVTASPTAPVVGGGSTTLTVRFAPTGTGSRAAALHVVSNDADENPFDIILNGTGITAGFMDPTFDPNVAGTYVNGTAVQSDGKILIVGNFTSVGGLPRSNLARLNTDGTVDTSATFNAPTNVNGQILCIAVQNDGRIVVGGTFTSISGLTRNRIARLNSDGTVESTSTFNPGSGIGGGAGGGIGGVSCLAIQPDGKILVAGDFTSVSGQTRTGIARLNPDGSLESIDTFNCSTDGSYPEVLCVAVQPDGKIVLAGNFTTVNGQTRSKIARILHDGALEGSGTFTPSIFTHIVGQGDGLGYITSALIQRDGKIVIGGKFVSVNGQPRSRIARLNSDGTLESLSTFNPGTGLNDSVNSEVLSMALQADGRILVSGEFTAVNGEARGRIARLEPNGNLEGTMTFDAGTGTNNVAKSVAVRPDGRILLAGGFTAFNGAARNCIAQLANGAATQIITVPNSARVQWLRSGSAPELAAVTFDLSTDGGSSWIPLGSGAGFSGGWESTGLNLPPSGTIRTRGSSSGGYLNGSSGAIEQATPFTVTPNPDIVVEQPAGNNIADGGSVSFGSAVVANSATRTFTIKNPGYASLTGLGITIDGANSSDFTITASPSAPVASGGGSTAFTVQFTPAGSGARTAALHIASNDPDESPFDITLSGTGQPAGTVDPTFDPNVPGTYVLTSTVQPDGKILLGGIFGSVNGLPRNGIARLYADGTVESTATFNPGSGASGEVYNVQVMSIAVQPNGRILLGGTFTGFDGQPRGRIARLHANGTLESAASFNPGSGANGDVYCVALQPDGKILLGGDFTSINGQPRKRIARLNADGSLEGTATFNPGTGADNSVFNFAVQPDGKIVVAGIFGTVNGQPRGGIARLNADGSLESTATFNPGTGASGVYCMALQADGKILLGGGFGSVNGQTRNGIARLNADGSVESTATFNAGLGTDALVITMAVQADGKILLGGNFTTVHGVARNYIARLSADGTLENSATFNAGTNGQTRSLALQADGQILVGGLFTAVNGTARNNFARLNNYGATQSLTATSSTEVQWIRGGAVPEVTGVTFELSTDGGLNWNPLGTGLPVAGGWGRSGLNLPAIGSLRARGRAASGYGNGSTGLVEQVVPFSVTPSPEIVVEQPAGASLVDGDIVSYGPVAVGSNASRTFTVKNIGYGVLTGLGITINGPDAGMFNVTSGPTAPLNGPGGSTTFTVQFAHAISGTRTAALHIASNDADENPFDITLSGRNFSTNADLSGLALSTASLSPTFSATTTSYTATVPYGTFGISVAPIAVDANASITVNGVPVTSGSSSGIINLNTGSNLITTVVTAEDGTTTRTYSTTITRTVSVPGTVDPTFDPNVPGTYVLTSTVQPDGKILLGGIFGSVNGLPRNGIARLDADGTVESTATFNPGSGASGEVYNVQVMSIAVQPDGRILLGGTFTGFDGQPRGRIARLHANGTLESAASFNPGSGANGDVYCVALQPDGKILLGGDFTSINGQPRNHIARLNADGSLEGTATFNPGTGADNSVFNFAVQPDGKIVVAGIFGTVNGQPRSGIARLNADGSLETTATFNPGTGASGVYCMALQADGKILLGGGFSSVNGQTRNGIARLNADGSVESTDSFYAGPGLGADAPVYSLAVQADGKILLVGNFTSVHGLTRNYIARLNADGTLENSATFNVGTGTNGQTRSLALQADGQILVGGLFTAVNGTARNNFARLANNGATQSLISTNSAQVQWTRGGAAPEVEGVSFEFSTDSGLNWNPLGAGSRITGGWGRTGLNLPAIGSLRARGRAASGYCNGSSGLIEQVQSFANPPLVVTSAAGNLTITGASLNALVTPNGSATTYFEYGLTDSYGSTTAVQNVAGAVPLNVTAAVTGLAANTSYHYRVVATNAAGTVYGEDVPFDTLPDPPTAVTANALAITSSSATLVGAVNPLNRATQVHFEYGFTTLYGNSTPIQNQAAGNSVVEVTATITGLVANATYHYRIVATNSGGTGYGLDVPFVATNDGTPTAKPSVTTGGVTDVTTTTATLLGTVNPNGGITNAFFEYGTTKLLGSVSSALGVGNGVVPANLFWALSRLEPGTTYYYRLAADNSLGITRGSILLHFKTRFLPPVVTTGSASALTTTSVRVHGTVRASGASTRVFFESGTDGINFPNRIDATPATVTGDTETAASADLTNLQGGVTYYYRIRAESEGGAPAGDSVAFTPDILSGLTQVFPLAPPPASGRVTVTLTPSGIASGWRFAGEQQWRASGVEVSGLTTSDRVIECMPVNDYIQPPPEPVSVISGGAPVAITLAYYNTGLSGSGGLSVMLKPDSLAAPGEPEAGRAQWRLFRPGINDDPWLNSGELLTGLAPGNYLVECKPVAGRSTPPPGIARVEDGSTSLITITYFLAEAQTGAVPTVLPFATVAGSRTMPYAYVGQIRSDAGSSSGFVVKPRVVATAGHVVFDDGTLAAVTGLQWVFQRDSSTYEPKPQIPRGVYLLDDYAAMRTLPGVVPGEGTLQSQNRDAAALYFLEDASRGGYAGFLASDLTDNEFLGSSAQKILVGYPVDSLAGFIAGRMYATAPLNASFARVPTVDELGNPFRTYTSADIRGSGGISGGPLCVQYEGGNYFPAAIYLGGSGQTVVRSIDSQVIEVFKRAELSSIAGDNNSDGGITFSSYTSLGTTQNGGIKVTIMPAAAASHPVAHWRLESNTGYNDSMGKALGLAPGNYTLQLTTVSGFQVPTDYSVSIQSGKLLEIIFTYAAAPTPLEMWRQANFGTPSNTGRAADGADPDGDGQTNLSEYAAGTNPNNASDVFKVLTVEKTATSFTLTADGKAGRSYVMERSIAPGAAPWMLVSSSGPLAVSGTVSLTDPAPPAQAGFYRLRVTAP
ncbi:MAG: choice-of-anchor D domain-containing protein [Verrucomicrobia bacterium]|nr:choice-of-anchor D domain-containing protein [Verrucomicrobiota bacterium]